MKSVLLYIVVSIIFISCSSTDQSSSDEISLSPCDEAQLLYDSLKSFTNNNKITDFSAWEYRNKTADVIKALIDSINKISCNQQRDIAFATTVLTKVESMNSASEKRSAEELSSGEDLFMDGVKINSQELLYNSNMEPYLKCEVENNTPITIVSIEFQIVYCNRTINGNSAMVRYDPDCFENIRIKSPINGHSTREYRLPLSSNIYDRERSAQVYLIKLLRNDGKLVERLGLF